MAEFTKEQLIEWAQTHKKRAEEYLATVPGDEYGLKDLALFEIALAALKAPVEPVYQYRIRNGYNGQVTEWQTIRRDQVDFVLKAQPHNAEFQIITPVTPQLTQPALDLREVFEAWARSKCWDVRQGETGAYISMCTHDGWTVVSACRDAIIAAKGDCR